MVSEVSSARALSLSHSELAGLIHTRGMEVMWQLLQGHMELRGPGDARGPVRTREGVVLTHQRWDRGRQWESIFGTIAFTRVGYGAKAEGMVYPLDADLNLPTERYSLGVRRRVAQEAVRGSFDEAVATVTETTGARVPKRQAEELTVRAAADVEAFYAQADAPAPSTTGPILVVSVDGKGVVMREADLREPTRRAAQRRRRKLPRQRSKGEKSGSKRMATVATVYTIAPYVRTPEQVVAQLMESVRLATPPGRVPRASGSGPASSRPRPTSLPRRSRRPCGAIATRNNPGWRGWSRGACVAVPRAGGSPRRPASPSTRARTTS